eukprot:754041-Rhodomonas_salina.1
MEPAELQGSLRTTLTALLESTASTFHTVQVLSMDVDRGEEQCAQARRRRSVRHLLADWSSASAAVRILVVFHEGAASTFDLDKFASLPGVHAVQADAANSPKITIGPIDCAAQDCGEAANDSDSDSSSSNNVPLIAGIAGGVGGALVLGGAAALWMRGKREPAAPVAVQTINVDDLKAQLSQDV